MSPQQDQPPGLPLPQPSFDMGGPSNVSAPPTYQSPMGQGMTGPTQVPQPFGSVPPASANSTSPPAGSISVPPAQVPQQPLAAAPLQDVPADDETAVDQEWIAKAREIVSKTHSDPYLQSKEISRIKAQYIKVRYNKDIKTVEE